MENILSSGRLADILRADFPEVSVSYNQLELGGTIHAFFLTFQNEKVIAEKWRKIANAIAVYFQSKVVDEFGKWNTYLFYLNVMKLSRDLKYKIENDLYSSRKIVVEGNGIDHQSIVEMHILNNDLGVEKIGAAAAASNPKFKKNELILDALTDKETTGKKQVTAGTKQALEQIQQVLKDRHDAL